MYAGRPSKPPGRSTRNASRKKPSLSEMFMSTACEYARSKPAPGTLDKNVTSRRVRDATELSYLLNIENRRGRPARIVIGDPMPEMVKLPPEPGELVA